MFGDNSNNQCSSIQCESQKEINAPLLLSKQKEFGLPENSFITQVVCDENETYFYFDKYKRCSIY